MTFNPELLRRQMEISTAPKPIGVRGLELPPPGKTAKDMLPVPPKKRLETGKLAWSAAAGILIGVNLAPKVQEYVDNPDSFNPQAIMRDITSFPGAAWNKVVEISQGFNWFKKEEIVVPDTFDPNAKKGVIGENNSIKVTPEEFKSEVNGINVSVPIIVRLPEGVNDPINYAIGSSGMKKEIVTETGEKRQVPINDILTMSGLPIGTEIVSPWKGKINQGTFRFQNFSDGSVEYLQSVITFKDRNGKKIVIYLSTGRVKVGKDIPRNDFGPVLENDSVPAVDLEPGEVIGTIASTANSRFFDGQVSISVISDGAANVQIATKDGKAITLQGLN